MRIARTIAAYVLAVPLLIFGANYFLQSFALPAGDGSPGEDLLRRCTTAG